MRYGNRYIMLLVIMAVSQWSCVKDPKDIPPGFSSDSVFEMQGTFGNESISLEAGMNGMTMIPVTTYADSHFIFSSVFSQDGCLEPCPGSWAFHFFQDEPLTTDASSAFANTIRAGEKELAQPSDPLDSFQITLTTHPGLFMTGYSYWEDFSGSTFFEHEYHTTIGGQDSLEVCFESLAYTGCQYSQCITFDPSTLVPCIAYVEAQLENPRYVSLGVRPSGTPPFKYLWYNGSTSQNIVVAIQDSVTDVFASVTVIDARNNKTKLQQLVRVQNPVIDPCYFPIDLVSIPTEYPVGLDLTGKAIVSYVDDSGDRWSSVFSEQSTQNKVTIHSVTPYGISPAGDDAFLVECSVLATLYHEITGEARIFSTQAMTIALSHP